MYFWLIVCCSLKCVAFRNATLSCLTQMMLCHSPCYHYPYKTLHTEARTVTFAVLMCLPALWVMPCLHWWHCKGACVPFHHIYHIAPVSACGCLTVRRQALCYGPDCPRSANCSLCNLCEDADELAFPSYWNSKNQCLQQLHAQPSAKGLCSWATLLEGVICVFMDAVEGHAEHLGKVVSCECHLPVVVNVTEKGRIHSFYQTHSPPFLLQP